MVAEPRPIEVDRTEGKDDTVPVAGNCLHVGVVRGERVLGGLRGSTRDPFISVPRNVWIVTVLPLQILVLSAWVSMGGKQPPP